MLVLSLHTYMLSHSLRCILICCLCVFACLYMHNHADIQRLEEGVGSGVGFTGNCEPPDVLLRTKLGFFERASALND